MTVTSKCPLFLQGKRLKASLSSLLGKGENYWETSSEKLHTILSTAAGGGQPHERDPANAMQYVSYFSAKTKINTEPVRTC